MPTFLNFLLPWVTRFTCASPATPAMRHRSLRIQEEIKEQYFQLRPHAYHDGPAVTWRKEECGERKGETIYTYASALSIRCLIVRLSVELIYIGDVNSQFGVSWRLVDKHRVGNGNLSRLIASTAGVRLHAVSTNMMAPASH